MHPGAKMGSRDDHSVQHIVTGPGPEVINTGAKGRDGACGRRDCVLAGELHDHVAGNKRREGENNGAHAAITSHRAFEVPAEGSGILDEAFFEGDAERAAVAVGSVRDCSLEQQRRRHCSER